MDIKFPKEGLFKIADMGPDSTILEPIELRDLGPSNVRFLKRIGVEYLEKESYKVDHHKQPNGSYSGLTECVKGDYRILVITKKERKNFDEIVPEILIRCNKRAEKDAKELRDFIEGEYKKYFPEY